ncbi:hypothetical protein FACS1894182_09480 [Bacteroidia bacterium]|nr:hypothetical protein FACS1894182_09480 [Bacteroidia bacterium]
MKKRIVYIMALFAVVFMTGCEKESSVSFSDTQVEIKNSNVSFTAAGGSGTIEISASESGVAVSSDQSWCTVSLSGNVATVTVSPNIDCSSRTALITVKAKEKVNYVPVTQEPVFLSLDHYDFVFLGKGETQTVSYKVSAQVPVSVNTDDAPWVSASVANGEITLKAAINPDFLQPRTGEIKFVAGNQLVIIPVTIMQGEAITSYEPDPNVNAVATFVNLKNYNGTASRYKVTYFSTGIDTVFNNLKNAYPTLLQDNVRIETPRNTNELSVYLYGRNGTTDYMAYWNCAAGSGGLKPVSGAGSNYTAVFAFTANTQTNNPAYQASPVHPSYTKLRAFFAEGSGFMIFPDTGNTFWFRSVANPSNYFKATPATW